MHPPDLGHEPVVTCLSSCQPVFLRGGRSFPGDRTVRLRARGLCSQDTTPPRVSDPILTSFSHLFAVFLSPHLCLCSVPSLGCPPPPNGLRNCQTKVMAQVHRTGYRPRPTSTGQHSWQHQGEWATEKEAMAVRNVAARAWQLGCHVGWEGGALPPREQAGFGGSRLCLHLPRTPSPRAPLIPRASPTPGFSAKSAHLQLLLQSCLPRGEYLLPGAPGPGIPP